VSTTNEPQLPADLLDTRLIREQGLRAYVGSFTSRLRSGDLGSLPVVVGLVVIWLVFYLQNDVFLSSRNLVNLALQSAAIGTISLGIVMVLLVAEIDLSIGSVSGVSAAVLAVGFVNKSWPLVVAVAVGILVGTAIGLLYGFLYTRFGVPSFVITLAGLLGFLGLQLKILGDTGSINIPFDTWLVKFAQQAFLPASVAYALAIVVPALYGLSRMLGNRRRAAAGLSTQPLLDIGVRAGLLLVALLIGTWYLNQDRGVSAMFLLFLALVVLMDLMLRKTRWGRSVYAIGGNVEAARRAGIAVNRVYVSVFVLCSTFAALGGVLAAARGAVAGQSSGGGDTNLNAIAAAVIGGTSLFGGRGSAYSALLGVLVITSISSGLTLMNLDSSVRYMITGAVLLLAVIIDSLSRRSRRSHGRA
jgi:ABC-type xylose transport system permease subunit